MQAAMSSWLWPHLMIRQNVVPRKFTSEQKFREYRDLSTLASSNHPSLLDRYKSVGVLSRAAQRRSPSSWLHARSAWAHYPATI